VQRASGASRNKGLGSWRSHGPVVSRAGVLQQEGHVPPALAAGAAGLGHGIWGLQALLPTFAAGAELPPLCSGWRCSLR